MSNTVVYQEEWEAKLQDRLNKPQNWKEICEVVYTDTKTLHRPYSTDPAVQTSQTRGTVYTFQDISETDESIAIDTYDNLPEFIDRADLAQSQFSTQMFFADRQGTLINERIEAAMLGQHAQWTNIGDDGTGAVALASTALTVTATNIDDIIRGVIREIQKANGFSLMQRNGAFIVWRPADWELLIQFMQANGFTSADMALRDGVVPSISYMGVTHYVSNSHTAGHIFAGIRKLFTLGIVSSTYGKVVVTQDPAGSSGGNLSGIGIVSRVDYKFKAWNKTTPVLFDINVN